MRLLDTEFLERIAASPLDPAAYGDALTSLEVPAANPYLDIAAIADLHLDRGYDPMGEPSSADDTTHGAVVAVASFQRRFRQLHRKLAGRAPSHLAVVTGDLLCERPSDAAATDRYRDLVMPALEGIRPTAGDLLVVPGNTDACVGSDGLSPYHAEITSALVGRGAEGPPAGLPVATLVRVALDEDPAGSVPIAYVAVIGFDSNSAIAPGLASHDLGLVSADQLARARSLVTTLRSGLGRMAPVYFVAVTHHGLLPRGAANVLDEEDRSGGGDHSLARSVAGMTTNAAAVLAELQRMRVSLLLHADLQDRAITTLVRTPVDLGARGSDIALVPLASFDPDAPAAGMVRLRLNLWRGEAEVGYTFDRGPYDDDPSPLQTITPLQSASRISAAERRLLGKVTSLPHVAGSTAARALVASSWNASGYVPLCFDGGRGQGLEPQRSLRYYLLLLVREGPGGGYELLLSRHTPLRPSSVGYWDTLLLPAFTSVQQLLQRLRDDVLRQVVGKAADMDKARSAQRFEGAVGALLEQGESQDEDFWADQLREVASTELVKVSPTTGVLTRYEYRLVVLLPFVSGLTSDPLIDNGSAMERARERTIVSWLDELPRVARRGDPLTGLASIPIDAIMAEGAGLRWEPAADPDDSDDLDDDPDRAAELPPGAVWFPLPEADEDSGPWRSCPSIVARNGDVMTWVERELEIRRTSDGSLPPHLVMGRFQQRSGFQAHGDPRPFDGPDAPEGEPAASTVQALRRVTFLAGFGLDELAPYPPERIEIARVILQRRDGRRPVIEVFDAAEIWRPGVSLSEFELGDPLGVLRPVQRYVLRAGLRRAKDVNDFLTMALAQDPWGFVRASWGGLTDPVSLTPPIIEQICAEDSDSEDGGAREFVLCDGNHRVVERVWTPNDTGPRRVAAVAAIGTPVEPYYARAFSRYEWDMTAANQLVVTPPTAFKHATRAVPDGVARPPGVSEKLHYRRYYRNLERGFGPMGGQGGRYA